MAKSLKGKSDTNLAISTSVTPVPSSVDAVTHEMADFGVVEYVADSNEV